MGIKNRLLLQALGVFLVASGFLIVLAPSAPFTKELGMCESGAVRDVLAGNIILPRFLPGPIIHVPPLYWWLVALYVKALGWSELAFRFPSLIAAALTCAMVFTWSGVTLGPRVGFLAASALLLCHFFLDAARQPRMDSMLALFVTIAAASLERAISLRTQAAPLALGHFVAAAIALGLGALTKGVLGVILPGQVMVLFLLVRGRWRELFHFDLVVTFATGLAIGVAWFVAGYQLGGRPFIEWQVRMNLWSRFVPAGAGGADYCAHPFWYFGPQILKGFLPWSLYLPLFALVAWRRAGRRLPEPVVYALCWFAALFIFFSSSHGKCLIYILPAFPPLAIITGWAIVEAEAGLDQKLVRRLFDAANIVVAIAAAVIVIAALLVVGRGIPASIGLRLHPTDRRFLELLVGQGFSPSLVLWACFFLVGAGVVLLGLLRHAPTWGICGTLIIAAAGGWFWFGVMNPSLARSETLETFARQAAASVPAHARIGHFGLGDCELNFYSPRPLEPISQLSCDGQVPEPRFIIIREDDFNALPSTRRACFKVELAAAPNDSIGRRLLVKRTR